MPYVNIPNNRSLTDASSKIVGKLLGKLQNEVQGRLTEQVDQFRREGCPNLSGITKADQSIQKVNRTVNQIENRISKIRKLPKTLSAPLKGFKAAKKVILSLPIPQSVPPGFGIPVNITTKFADVMHLLKEFIVKIEEDIESINAVLATPETILKSTKDQLARLNLPVFGCKVEAALREEVAKGTITTQQLAQIGAYDEKEETYIFSRLVPRLVSVTTPQSELDSAQKLLEDLLFKLESSNIGNDNKGLDNATTNSNSKSNDLKKQLKQLIDSISQLNQSRIQTLQDYSHIGPNGILYKLEIQVDESSPSIAPKRFAVAKDMQGVVVMKGPKSFSSSVDVLLEEVKFRIDNQLA